MGRCGWVVRDVDNTEGEYLVEEVIDKFHIGEDKLVSVFAKYSTVLMNKIFFTQFSVQFFQHWVEVKGDERSAGERSLIEFH